MIRDEGPAEPFRRFLYRRGVYRRLALLVNPPTKPYQAPRPPPTGMVGSRLDASEIDDYLALRPDQSRAEIAGRLAAGHVCFVVRLEHRVVAHAWIGRGRIPIDYLGCTMELSADACHSYDDFVAAEFRGINTLRAVAPLRRAHRETAGIRWNVSLLLPENELAFQRIARHRPVFVGELGRWKLGPWQRLFLRLDRELVGSRSLPVSFVGPDGRPPRTRQVQGPLVLGHSRWASTREPSPGFPFSGWLDRRGICERRLVCVFGSDEATRVAGRLPVEVGRLEAGALEEYLHLRPEQSRAEVEQRWQAGHVCFVGRVYGRVVAASWLAPAGGSFHDLGCEIRLAPDAAGVYDGFVRPSARRQHVLDPVADHRSRFALDRGWKRCVTLVPTEVPGAWIRMRRNERRVVGELVRLGMGPLERWRLRTEPGVDRGELPLVIESRQGEVEIRS